MPKAGWVIAALGSIVVSISTPANGCPRDGTDGPCHCVDKLMAAMGDMQMAVSQVQDVHVFNFDFSTQPQGMPVMDATIHVGDNVH